MILEVFSNLNDSMILHMSVNKGTRSEHCNWADEGGSTAGQRTV